jgi:hypothetical protein
MRFNEFKVTAADLAKVGLSGSIWDPEVLQAMSTGLTNKSDMSPILKKLGVGQYSSEPEAGDTADQPVSKDKQGKAVSNDKPTVAGKAASNDKPTVAGKAASTAAVAATPSTSKAASGKEKVARGSVSKNDISGYLFSKGLSSNHVAGIMANIKHESSFNPAAIGDNGTSGGLFQHHGPRFHAMAKAVPNWKSNWKGQIDFALSEPAGRQYASIAFRTPQEASKWFTMYFEIPANKVAKANQRSRDASQYA